MKLNRCADCEGPAEPNSLFCARCDPCPELEIEKPIEDIDLEENK